MICCLSCVFHSDLDWEQTTPPSASELTDGPRPQAGDKPPTPGACQGSALPLTAGKAPRVFRRLTPSWEVRPPGASLCPSVGLSHCGHNAGLESVTKIHKHKPLDGPHIVHPGLSYVKFTKRVLLLVDVRILIFLPSLIFRNKVRPKHSKAAGQPPATAAGRLSCGSEPSHRPALPCPRPSARRDGSTGKEPGSVRPASFFPCC